MYKEVSVHITNYLLHQNIIKEDDREIYEYSVEVFISDLVYFFIAGLSAICLKSILQTLLYFIGFFSIRMFAGGYHADTYTKCHILFWLNQILMILAVKTLPLIVQSYISFLLAVLSLILVFSFAPVDNENKPFTNKERRKFKMISRIIVCIEFVIITILLMLNMHNQYIFCLIIGAGSVSISLCAAKIKTFLLKRRLKC